MSALSVGRSIKWGQQRFLYLLTGAKVGKSQLYKRWTTVRPELSAFVNIFGLQSTDYLDCGMPYIFMLQNISGYNVMGHIAKFFVNHYKIGKNEIALYVIKIFQNFIEKITC